MTSLKPLPKIEVIAHRGASAEFPENTMAAFRRALEIGADRIELDVQLTRDGQVVVFHDATLERTTNGEGLLSSHTWEELAGLDAGLWKGPEHRNEPIPRLDEVLRWSTSRMPLNVELKVKGVGARALVQATVALVRKHEAAEETLFSSFDPAAVTEVVQLCPESEVALLWGRREPPLELLEATGAKALHLAERLLTPALATETRNRGLGLRVYTINTEECLHHVLDLGAMGIITDVPNAMLRWVNANRGNLSCR